jgi:hypothetical protein
MSRTSKRLALAAGLAVTAEALSAIYWYGVRPWHLRWGATDDELALALPGDELIPNPRLKATHAVTIRAAPAQVWPWLVQLGQGRGGFYSYDWLENAMGLDIHNADRILPEYQGLKVGDEIPFAPNGFSVPVAVLEPARALVLHGDTRIPGGAGAPPVRPGEYLAVSWGFHLSGQADGTTRLVERWRADWTPRLLNNVMYTGFLEAGAFLMQRKMLLGIKQRAEAMPS